uniref:C-type lectin domain-containing protein n=1 Tax=Sinocyclocheilus rhinocerous TaxID=307959 RepID=A0A673L5J8_9TELE
MTSVLQRRALISFPVVFLLWFTECFSADSHCDEGYLLFGEHCYHFETETVKNWQDAENYCVAQNGHLVSIHNQETPFEQGFIQAQIQSVPTGVSLWMGAHDSITEGGWMWTDGSPFRYINWASGNPDDYYNEDCLSILINSGAWNDDNCENKRGYICNVINIQSAFYGCRSDKICPYGDGASGKSQR